MRLTGACSWVRDIMAMTSTSMRFIILKSFMTRVRFLLPFCSRVDPVKSSRVSMWVGARSDSDRLL